MHAKNLILKPVPQNQQKKKIPAKINIFLLTEIPEFSNAMCSMTELIFPQSSRVKKICRFAFAHCNMLKKVIINGNVEEIGEGCFFNCEKLYKFKIKGEPHLRVIGANAFRNTKLDYFIYPPSLRQLDKNSFFISEFRDLDFSQTKLEILDPITEYWYSSLKLPCTIKKISILAGIINIGIEPGGKYFKSESSLIYSAVKNEIIFSNKFVRHTFIREGIEFIGESAFARSQIRRITFPCSLKEIGPDAFDSCTELKTIRFKEPSSLISIGDYAFYHNDKIERVKFPSSLMRIGKHAFQWNSQLKVVQFPLSIVEIDDFAFFGCLLLSKVLIPCNSKLRIFGIACFGSTNIEEFSIPLNVQEILGNIFTYSVPHAFKFYRGPINISEDYSFIRKNNEVIASLNCQEELFLPDGIKEIKSMAFFEDKEARVVHIPSSIERIEDKCFSYSEIKEIVFENNSLLNELPEKFLWKTSISRMNLPNSVEKIPYNSLADQNLESLVINNSFFKTNELGIVFSLNPRGIVYCPPNKIKTMNFSGIEVIYGGAFQKAYIAHLDFDKTLKFVGKNSFKPPETIKFHPDSHIEMICKRAFLSYISSDESVYNMDRIAVIKIPRLVDEIRKYVFNCKEIVFPRGFECKKISKSIGKTATIKFPRSIIPKLAHLENENFIII